MMGKYKRFFGTGPKCVLICFILIIMVYYLEGYLGIAKMSISDLVSKVVFIITIILTLVFFTWGIISLPGKKRGVDLVTSGAYKYIRHPLYASFIVFFIFGLSIFLKSYGVLISWVSLIFVCGKIVENEEKYCISLFGKEYKKYKDRTKKFIPRIY